MNRCIICGTPVGNYGNNPYPLCDINDTEHKCCDLCNIQFVIPARLIYTDEEPVVNDGIIIFNSKNSEEPLESMRQREKYLRGTIESVEVDPYNRNHKIFRGTWGSFGVDNWTDQYTKYAK